MTIIKQKIAVTTRAYGDNGKRLKHGVPYFRPAFR